MLMFMIVFNSDVDQRKYENKKQQKHDFQPFYWFIFIYFLFLNHFIFGYLGKVYFVSFKYFKISNEIIR